VLPVHVVHGERCQPPPAAEQLIPVHAGVAEPARQVAHGVVHLDAGHVAHRGDLGGGLPRPVGVRKVTQAAERAHSGGQRGRRVLEFPRRQPLQPDAQQVVARPVQFGAAYLDEAVGERIVSPGGVHPVVRDGAKVVPVLAVPGQGLRGRPRPVRLGGMRVQVALEPAPGQDERGRPGHANTLPRALR